MIQQQGTPLPTFTPATPAQAAPFIAHARATLGASATPANIAGLVARAMLAQGFTNGYTLAIVALLGGPKRSTSQAQPRLF